MVEHRKNFVEKLLIAETSNFWTQLFRYVIVGGLSFVVDYGLLYALTEWAGMHYLLSATLSFVAGLLVNYFISTCWIFHKSKLNNKLAEFLIYSIIGVVGLLFNNLLLYVLTDHLHLYYMLSKLIAAAVVLGWNFVGRKLILFKP